LARKAWRGARHPLALIPDQRRNPCRMGDDGRIDCFEHWIDTGPEGRCRSAAVIERRRTGNGDPEL